MFQDYVHGCFSTNKGIPCAYSPHNAQPPWFEKRSKVGMLEFPMFFAPLCVLAGACRIVGISNVFARLSAPGHRSGRVVMAQTRKTLGDSNNSGAHEGRIRP